MHNLSENINLESSIQMYVFFSPNKNGFCSKHSNKLHTSKNSKKPQTMCTKRSVALGRYESLNYKVNHSRKNTFSFRLSAKAIKMSAASSVDRKQIGELLAFIQPLAVKAGELLMEGYTIEKNVDIKSEFYDVVTQYDHKIEQFLMQQITAVYPNHKFVAEEEVAKTDCTPTLTDAPTWIIDPIDGTSNFIKMLPHTCVSIGLAINKQVVLGVVNNPVTKHFYTATIGNGAFRNGERITVSDCKELKNANIGYEVSLLHAAPLRDKHIKRIYYLGSAARRMVSYASVVESLCYVATGQLDAYPIDDMYPWDCAAASLLIREAGGVIYHPYGGEFDVMKPDLVAAGTESLCREVMDVIQRADKTNSVGGDKI